MKPTDAFDLVFIGSYTKDVITSHSGTRQVDGGGFNYGAHVGAMMGVKTAAVTRLAKEDSRVVEKLERVGVTVFPAWTQSSTEIHLDYPSSNPDERTLRVPRMAGPFTPDQVAGLQSRAFLLNGSFLGEVGLDVIAALKKKSGWVVGDAQGFIRVRQPDGSLQFEPSDECRRAIALFDILKVDAVEAHALTGENNLHSAARLLAASGPKEIVLTHRDGIVVFAEGQFCEAPFCPRELVGRSGRGDTCIASYVAKRLSAPPAVATTWAAAATSLKLEAEGPITRSLAEVTDLFDRLRKQRSDAQSAR